MAVSRPSNYPEWAETLTPSDPTTGQPSRVEPVTAKKQSGFEFREYPARNVLNWLFHTISNWIKWLTQEEDKHKTVTANGNGLGLTAHENHTFLIYAVDKTAPGPAGRHWVGVAIRATGNNVYYFTINSSGSLAPTNASGSAMGDDFAISGGGSSAANINTVSMATPFFS